MVLRFLVIYKRRMDTEGVAVDSAVAGRNLTAEKVADAIKASGIEGKSQSQTQKT
jgi:CO dehydrogenase/acetyl-CoA synthase gamma subunit (corrinoid Fe-S protein)